MKRSTKNIAKIFLIISAVLCAALILIQLVPYWTYEDTLNKTTETISVLEYLALPSDHYEVTMMLKATSSEVINSLAGTFCIALLLGVVSIIFILIKPNSLWVSVWPVIVGAGTLIGYLTEPLWKLGSAYPAFVAISAALTACALVPAIIGLCSIKYWFMDPKKLPNAK